MKKLGRLRVLLAKRSIIFMDLTNIFKKKEKIKTKRLTPGKYLLKNSHKNNSYARALFEYFHTFYKITVTCKINIYIYIYAK